MGLSHTPVTGRRTELGGPRAPEHAPPTSHIPEITLNSTNYTKYSDSTFTFFQVWHLEVPKHNQPPYVFLRTTKFLLQQCPRNKSSHTAAQETFRAGQLQTVHKPLTSGSI